MADIDQAAQNRFGSVRMGGVVNFVPHAVKDDRGVIAITQNAVPQVGERPFFEIQMIVLGILPLLPAIEKLVHHEKSHLIAQIEKFGGGRIVRSADGIDSEVFQRFQPPFPNTQRYGGTDGSAIMVKANALEFQVFPVEPEPGVAPEFGVANAKRGPGFVDHLASGGDLGEERVKLGSLEAPKPGVGDFDLLLDGVWISGGKGNLGAGRAKCLAFRIENCRADGDCGGCLARVFHRRFDGHRCGIIGCVWSRDIDSPRLNVNWSSRHQADMAVNTASRVPPGCRLRGSVGFDGEDVWLVLDEVIGEVVAETHVSVRTLSERVTIDPHLAAGHHSIEFHPDPLIGKLLGNRERFPVPSDPRRQPGAGAGGGGLLIEVSFDAPVVGDVQFSPARRVKGGGFRPCRIAGVKRPVRIERGDGAGIGESDPPNKSAGEDNGSEVGFHEFIERHLGRMNSPRIGLRDTIDSLRSPSFSTHVSEKRTREREATSIELYDEVEVPTQGMFFGAMWLLLLVATLMVQTEWAEFHGSLLIGLGALVLVCRPAAKIPRSWWILAGIFVMTGAFSFLPAKWFYYPAWRTNFDRLDIATGSQVVIQARQAAEQFAVFVITLLVGIWMAGFRANGFQLRLWSLAFTTGVAAYAIASKILLDRVVTGPLIGDEHYGFFPNRNHTATYLVMGSICGVGSVLQAIRDKRYFLLILSLIPTAVCLWALVGLSISRAGPVLLMAGCMGWLMVVGLRYLGTKVIISLIVIAAAAATLFFAYPSKVKDRLFSAVESVATDAPGSANGNDDDGTMAKLRKLDFRIPTALDTFTMIRDFKWTGVGAGQFVYVFPQYRYWASVENDLYSKHPENDWLWMASEAGVPAALALAGITVLAAAKGLKSVRRGRERALRGACLVAALVVPFHGLMDVPGHRITLALSACWLFAMALSSTESTVKIPPAWPYWFPSLAVVGVGLSFLHGGWWGIGRPATGASDLALERVEKPYWEHVKPRLEAQQQGVDYIPPTGGDPMEKAIRMLEREIEITPLDRQLIRCQALYSLNFWDKIKLIERDFAWELALQPAQVTTAWWQAEAWGNLEPTRCNALVQEALHRADRLDRIQQGTRWSRQATLAKIRDTFRYKPDLQKWILLPP